MEKPPVIIQLPDPLKHFAKDPPAWKLAALVVVLLAMVTINYFWTH